jgi:O-antigen biosynthesis protein WbqP
MIKNNNYAVWKRCFDIFFSIILIFCTFPFFLIIAALIYLEDQGNPIFTQVRAGKNHEPFILYKFRSMKLNTPNLSTAELQKTGINPVTKIGKFLRKSSLDELPQLFNILQGKMSFIGPRPALISQIEVLNARKVTGVDILRPGITGLAQVKGRDDLSDQEKVFFDNKYLKRFGIYQDIEIIFATIYIVVRAKGNY